MNPRNIKGIKLKTPNGHLIYEVVFFLRSGNDLRSPGAYGDKRRVGNNIGDGWNDETNRREVLNEHVEEMVERFDRMGEEYTILFESDMKTVA